MSQLATAEVVGQTKKPDGTVEFRVRIAPKGKGGKRAARDEVLVAGRRRASGSWCWASARERWPHSRTPSRDA